MDKAKQYLDIIADKINLKELENVKALKKVASVLKIEVRTLIIYISLAMVSLVLLNYGAMLIN